MPGPRSFVDRLAARSQRLRVPVLVFIILLGIGISGLMSRQTWRQEQRVLTLTFQDDVQERLVAISRALEQSLEQVRTLGDFLRSGRGEVDSARFAEFALPTLRRHPTIHALAWVPRVTREEREAFEAAASRDLGRPFRITQASATGEAVPAGERAVYYPLTLVEPRDRRAATVGADLAPDPERMRTLEQAAAEGRLVLSPPLETGADGERRRTVVAFAPVYAPPGGGDEGAGEDEPEAGTPRPLLGFAVAEFLVADVVGDYLGAWRHGDLRVHLFDVSMPVGEQRLYPPEAPGTEATPDDVIAASRMQAAERLRIGGREWLLICTPSPAYLAEHRTPGPWVVLAVGLVLTGLVGVILYGMIRASNLMAALALARERVNDELRQRIADREAGERALSRANEDLRRANQDLERFVGAVSHDLKSPLVAAEMLVSVLQQAVAKQDLIRAGETSAQIRKACTRMRRIIEDLLEHQRAGYADMRTTPVDLVEVALSVIEEHRREWTAKRAHVQLQDDLPTVRADRARLTGALENLFLNAIRYGGAETDPPRIVLGCTITGGEVRLFVRDHGPGVPPEHREQVFELFRRFARDDDGTGIGLAIVRRVAEAHGGRAWVECPPPEEGGGSVFYFALPRDRLVRGEPGRPEPAPPAQPLATASPAW